uniref:Small ribosomal subunit protein uS7 domain-containing protein n=1 Tax=Glossina austeni TaxID=7395 RepID=A0A1A9V879_GLOAU
MTKGGNKKLARELLERTFENIKRTQIERLNLGKGENIIVDPYALLLQAIENCRPLLNVTAIKRGGVTYQVPVSVTEKHSYFLSMKWLLEAAREKVRKIHLREKLAWEILDAAHGQGRVTKRENDLHKLCEDTTDGVKCYVILIAPSRYLLTLRKLFAFISQIGASNKVNKNY